MNKFSFYKAIPSLITVTAFVLGFNAIMLAIKGEIELAIIALFVSGLLDMVDGRVARLLGVSGQFGAELDSLSDFVCFGVGSAIIVLFFNYFVSNTLIDGFLVASVTFFAVGAMLRLARFNLDVKPEPAYKGFFVGVPTPAGFGLAILPIAVYYSFGWLINANLYGGYMIAIGFLMVSRIPTPSVKAIRVSRKFLAPFMGIIALFIIMFIKFMWLTLVVIGIIYVILTLFGFKTFLRNKKLVASI